MLSEMKHIILAKMNVKLYSEHFGVTMDALLENSCIGQTIDDICERRFTSMVWYSKSLTSHTDAAKWKNINITDALWLLWKY